ncbi:MAG: hypothetical protein PWP39_1616 [Pyrococcus sp.]|nr:hypothetical protein [Pyrococcus sp.]
MKIIFIPHALERMKERGIPKTLVIETNRIPRRNYYWIFWEKNSTKTTKWKINSGYI